MEDNNELIITYGLGYVFKKNKFIGILKTKDFIKRESDFNINEEIEYLNSSQITIYKNKYIEKIEDALGEKVLDIIFLIIDIRGRNSQHSQDTILDKYKKNHFAYLRYLREDYRFKNINYVQSYLDRYFNGEETNKLINYDRVTLKVLLTTSFGDRLGNFIENFISSSKVSDGERIRAEQIKESFNKSKILEVNYKNIDFILLVKDLVIHEKLEGEENIDYRKVLKSVNKSGSVEEDKYEFRQQIVSFLKEESYLYFTYAKFQKENIITTLDNERYLYKGSYLYKLLCKYESYLFDPIAIKIGEERITKDEEFGFLLSYNKDKVIVCAAILNKNINRVSIIDKVRYSDEKVVYRMKKYIEI